MGVTTPRNQPPMTWRQVAVDLLIAIALLAFLGIGLPLGMVKVFEPFLKP